MGKFILITVICAVVSEKRDASVIPKGASMSNLESVNTGKAVQQSSLVNGPETSGGDESMALFAGLFALINGTPDQVAEAQPASPEGKPNPPSLPLEAQLTFTDAPLQAAGATGSVAQQLAGLPTEGADRLTRLLIAAGHVLGNASSELTLSRNATDATDTGDTGDAGDANILAVADNGGDITPSLSAVNPLLTEAAHILKNMDLKGRVAVSPHTTYSGDVSDLSSMMAAINTISARPTLPVNASEEKVPAAEFIGPMPAVQTAPASEFIGPMPAVQTAPAAEFIGPMPRAVTVISAQNGDWSTQSVLQPPSPQFVGPMPLADLRSSTTIPLTPTETKPGNVAMGAVDKLGEFADGDPLSPVTKGVTSDKGGADKGRIETLTMGELKSKGGEAQASQNNLRQQADLTQKIMARAADQSAQITKLEGARDAASGVRNYAESAPNNSANSGSSGSGSTSASVQSLPNSGSGQGSGMGSGMGGGGQQSGAQSNPQQSGGVPADLAGARDASGRVMLHRLNMSESSWPESMVKRLEAGLQSGAQKIRIILQPQRLGRLNVELGLRKGGASIRVSAETPEAARQLGSARHQLSQMLDNAGMKLASLQTSSVGDESSFDMGNGSTGQNLHDADRKNSGGNQSFSNKVVSSDTKGLPDDAGEDSVIHRLEDGETAMLSILA
jgi:hypothetical protein